MKGQIWIENIKPLVDGGKRYTKVTESEFVFLECDIVSHGTDKVNAAIFFRHNDEKGWKSSPMKLIDNDSWAGSFQASHVGLYKYKIRAWHDPVSTLLRDCKKWLEAGEDIKEDVNVIKKLIAKDKNLTQFLRGLETDPISLVNEFFSSGNKYNDAIDFFPKHNISESDEYSVFCDPKVGGFASWYEIFPRSQGPDNDKSGTFKDCVDRLDDIKEMGFDVVYLTPIHPIGITNRVGKNGSRQARPEDPGSPWAIGNKSGGHKSINQDLGTLEDFVNFVNEAKKRKIEVALDIAFQCSPDHPYVKEHPEWFKHREDGSIRYAENPPKKYYDIYPIDFDTKNKIGLWNELKSIFDFWIDLGIRIFRVDNPHTKPLDFWEWCLNSIKKEHPDTVFLSEAFTRPKLMYSLTKAGFNESYTYFTWRNYDFEIRDYFTELSDRNLSSYFRPMLFTNTPDILPFVLQTGGRNAFILRAVLAGFLSPLWGIYSGYELCENAAINGKEEYLNSEKYEIRKRDWFAPGNIRSVIARINQIRNQDSSFQGKINIKFLPSSTPNILFFRRLNETTGESAYVAVNINPY
ncbi:MAG: maltotransferase domain-containing protein, partial [Thermoplasmatales archaeon]